MTDTLRVSASDLDALRYFLAQEDGDLDKLLRQLRREEPPTEAMQAGTALHSILEHAVAGEMPDAECGGFRFDFEADGELSLPAIREMKETRLYKIDGVRVTLVGKVDAICGKRIEDHKFTMRYDPERFLSSLQWRVYLEVFDADTFVWNVFEARERGERHYAITALHRLTMHRYPGMDRDVEAALRQFLDFARIHLPERLIPWEPTPADYLAVG